jgi:fibronectin-binding autotransporter adhesin
VYGSLVLGEDSILHVRTELSPYAFAEGDAWKLFDWEGLAERQGSFANTVLPNLSPELKWDLSALYTQGVIQVVAIPEPGRMLLLGIALVCVSLRRRRN